MVEVGTAKGEPLSDSVLASGFLVELWLLLPTMQHPITQHPATATPCSSPTTWYWCDPYQQYYPYVASCPTAWRQVVQ
jgi:hypothetical protein